MEIIELKREFIFERDNPIVLDDPDQSYTPNEVLEFYSNMYPELTTASVIGPTIEHDTQVYRFKTVIGMKG